MRIAATGDIHSPDYLELFQSVMARLAERGEEIACLLLCGDLVDRSRLDQLGNVRRVLEGVDIPIFSCFGNNEYEEHEAAIREGLPNVRFLDDEVATIEIGGRLWAILGSRGILDVPTFWQRRNVPDISRRYEERVRRLGELSARISADVKVLLIHYPPTLKIVEGENPRILRQLGSSKLEHLIPRFDLVITGHTHKGEKEVRVGGALVVNVALPLRKEIAILSVERRGLDRFF